MTTMFVSTTIGSLAVRVVGAGRPALLWHSLYADSTTWGRVEPTLARHRRLVMIDGPAHGDSPAGTSTPSLSTCAAAACEVLDALGIADPVDWLGNAWGGHVGIAFASEHPERCRSLCVVGTPIPALTAAERAQIRLLMGLYRVLGPAPLADLMARVLLGEDVATADPEAGSVFTKAYARASRRGLRAVVRGISLGRPDLTPVLGSVAVPTLMVCAAEDSMLSPDAAATATRRLPQGGLSVLPTAGHIGPLLRASEQLGDLLARFWDDPATVAASLRVPVPTRDEAPTARDAPAGASAGTWGVVAAYTGCLSAAALVLFYALADPLGARHEAWMWLGPANDVLSIAFYGGLSAAAILTWKERRGTLLGTLAALLVLSSAASTASTLRLLTGVGSLREQGAAGVPLVVLLVAWLVAAARTRRVAPQPS